ncbi:haloacid dehalogenase superfamily, subfamily IA, variant 3 with third motif having DD or ED/haloacid dehalogenase superfamily, subfamily IA, variant 1 with third motif having Dx(3-4)D or Dx(3-4)E [Oscillospiraceae bacterium]|nr:haloacid dehalogenase superfamily, subfamily IA, variant 3 with third motif having DD or ED/haloacid dehalogenase superfamily, subfamily IA, variant 1 with third motif having Dx(3-4)D or Dx(3-4)E [Oscillospiraceae bacterium]
MNSIIFDMDGVIFDSEKAVFGLWKELAEKYGFPDIDEVYKRTVGVNSDSTRKIFFDHYGPDFPFDEYLREESQMYHSRYDDGRLPLKPDIERVLEYIKNRGYKIAIASSTRAELVKRQIENAGLIEYFDVIVGGDMVTRSKPHPDIFLEAAERLDAIPEETYVIEDSFNGIRAAHAGGFIPVMVPDMLPPDDEMKTKASFIFDTLREVESIL